MTIIEAIPVTLPPVPIPPCPGGYAIAFYERDECGRGDKYKWFIDSTARTMREVENDIELHRSTFGAIAFRVFQLPGDAT